MSSHRSKGIYDHDKPARNIHHAEQDEEELPDKIRIKFESLSKRLQKINVDIIHQPSENYNLQDISPFHKDLDEYDCFLNQELIRLRTFDTSSSFKQLHDALYPFVQSLPELLHHQNKIVQIFLENIHSFPLKYISSVFSTIAVFTRDLKEDIKPHFDDLFNALIQRTAAVSMSGGATEDEQTPNPELTAQLFETLSFLIKANSEHLIENPDDLSPYYGIVLGSSTGFVRDFASKTFTIVLRKLQIKTFKSHFKKIFKATSVNVANVVGNDYSQLVHLSKSEDRKHGQDDDQWEDSRFASEKPVISGAIRRCNYLLDGLSKLLFYSMKGIKGCLHSKSLKRIDAIFNLGFQSFLQIKTKDLQEQRSQDDVLIKDKFFLQIHGLIAYRMCDQLIYHLYPENQLLFLQAILQFIQSTIKEIKEEYFFTENQFEELYLLLIIQFLQLILRSEKLWKEKKKTLMKVNTLIPNLIIENTLELFHLLHIEQNQDQFQLSTKLVAREIFVQVWTLFPQATIFLDKERLSKLMTLVLHDPVNIENGLLYFARALFHELPGFSRENVLLPILLSNLEHLYEKVVREEWLTFALKLCFILQDHRLNTDQILKLGFYDVNQNILPVEQFINLIEITEKIFLEEIAQNLTNSQLLHYHDSASSTEGNGNYVTLRLSMLLINWIVKNLPVGSLPSQKTIEEKLLKFTKHIYRLLEPLIQAPSYGIIVNCVDLLITLECSSSNTADLSILQLMLKKLVSFFVQQPASLSLAYTMSILLEALRKIHSVEESGDFEDDTPIYVIETLLSTKEKEQLLFALSEGLTTSSFYRKYCLIQILKHFEPPIDRTSKPKAHIVSSNKREIDDSDEEGEYGRIIQTENDVQIFDVCLICEEILSFPVDIQHDREIRRRLEILEVFCRGNKLPKEFIAIIAGFALGLFYTKYKPIWSVCVNILITIAQSEKGEDIVWPLYLAILEKTSLPDIAISERPISTFTDLFINLEKFDTIERISSLGLKQSPIFFLATGPKTLDLPVQPDMITDRETVYLLLIIFLHKAPAILLKRSKILVEHFITFLTTIYYVAYSKDPEIASLTRIGLLSSISYRTDAEGDVDAETHLKEITWLSRKEISKRLETFLKAFAAVPSPKQLFKYGLLYAFYHEIITKADTTIAKLALECILTYKPVYAMPYKESLKNLYDDKTFRNELVNIDTENIIATAGGAGSEERDYRIKPEHREGFYHLIIRILYGRLLSKPTAKRNVNDQISARRSAIIGFIIRTNASAIRHLLYLMIRGIAISTDSETTFTAKEFTYDKKKEVFTSDVTKVEEFLSQGYERVQRIYSTMEKDFEHIGWERLQGFLHLLGPIFHIFGAAARDYVQLIYGIVLKTLSYAQNHRMHLIHVAERQQQLEEKSDHLVEPEEVAGVPSVSEVNDSNQAVDVRTLSLQRLSDIFEAYAAVLKIEDYAQELFPLITPLVVALPSAISQARKKPALLTLLEHISSHEETLPIITSQPIVVEKLIASIASPALELAISKSLFITLHHIFDSTFFAALVPFSELLVQTFTTRFHPTTTEEDNGTTQTHHILKISDVVCKSLGGLNIELQLLCKVAEKIFADKEIGKNISSISSTNLATIMLGMLRSYLNSKKLRVQEDWVLKVFHVYKSLIWRMDDVSSHLTFLSRLFGPTPHPASLFNRISIRAEIMNSYEVVGKHPSVTVAAEPIIDVMRGLVNYENVSTISIGRNISAFMPAIRKLSGSHTTWNELLGPSSFQKALKASKLVDQVASLTPKGIDYHLFLCSAIVFELIRTLHEEDIPIRTAGAGAIKALVTESIQWHVDAVSDSTTVTYQQEWLALLKNVIMPAIRKGIQSSTDLVKSTFISLFVHIIRQCSAANIKEEMFHTDLMILTHDDPDQDFFENICHIQLHRRTRAFFKLKNQLSSSIPINPSDINAPTMIGQQITSASYLQILIPIAFYYLSSNEFTKKIHRQFLQEIASVIGAMCEFLPFSHYLNVFRKIIKLLEKSALSSENDKQTIIQTALASLLDHFHYDLSAPAVVKKTVEQSVNNDKMEVEQPQEITEKENEDEKEVNEEERKEEEDESEDEESDYKATLSAEDAPVATIADTLIDFIFPTVKSFLIKETTDQNNKKTKVVESNIAIALINLLKQLQPPLVSPQRRLQIFSNIVIGIVDTLKSRDVNVRDTARNCLTKIVQILGFQAFEGILYEMQSMLTEGYQRHVSLYSLRSILTQITLNYSPPVDAKILTMEELSDLQTQLIDQNTSVADATGSSSSSSFLLKANQKNNKPTLPELLEKFNISVPEFDSCIPHIMKGVLIDLSDQIKEEREEIDGAIRTSTIREMKGSKFTDILEITSRCLLFRPTYALLNPSNPSVVSSIHAISAPLLDFLGRNAEMAVDDFTEATRSGRVAEALQRVAQGLAKNPSLDSRELLLYIHASLTPFVTLMLKQYRKYKESTGKIVRHAIAVTAAKKEQNKKKGKAQEESNFEEIESDLELVLPSYLREESSDEEESFAFLREEKKRKGKDEVTGYKAATWLPADWNAIKEQKQVIEERNLAQRELYRVQDGASAPTMTGRNRYDKVKRSISANNGIEKTTLIAIKYCLTLLVTCLKKGVFKPSHKSETAMVVVDTPAPSSVAGVDVQEMLVPFIPILRSFLHLPNASEIVILSIKSISQLILQNVYFENNLLNSITHRILMIMIQYNASKITAENELCQVCIQLLFAVFKRYNGQHKVKKPVTIESLMIDHRVVEETPAKGSNQQTPTTRSYLIDYPLPERRMKLLLESLTLAIYESNHSFQLIIFQLIREIIKTHILLPEIYDLILKLTDQIVLSHYKNIRLLSSKTVIDFLLSYPISKKRHEDHLEKLIALTDYQYETGRLSAYETIFYVIEHFPLPVIEDYAINFFLRMTVRLSKETISKPCQQEIMKILTLLFQKIQDPLIQQKIEDYLFQWLQVIVKQMKLMDLQELRGIEAGIRSEMIELVMIGCKILVIFIKSMIMKSTQMKTKLTKHQKDIMKRGYSIVYENILTVLEFHFLLNDESGEGESYVQRRLRDLNLLPDNALMVNKNPLSSFLIIPLHGKYWQLLYELLVVFDLSYDWNAEYVDQFISTVNPSTLAASIESNQLLTLLAGMTTGSSAGRKIRSFMEMICELLMYNHSWIRGVSLRILHHYLEQRIHLPSSSSSLLLLSSSNQDPSRLSISSQKSSSSKPQTYLQRLLQQKEKRLSLGQENSIVENEILLQSNSFYFIGRKLCVLFNQFYINTDYMRSLIKPIVLMIACMYQHPELDTLTPKEKSKRKRGREEGGKDENERVIDEAVEDDEQDEEDNEVEFNEDDREGINELEEIKTRDVNANTASRQINLDDDEDIAQDENEDEPSIQTTTGKNKARKRGISEVSEENNDHEDEIDYEDEEEAHHFYHEKSAGGKEQKVRRGLVWIMNRLRAIGADSRSTRRIRVLQLFIDLVQQQSQEFILQYLPQIIEIPIRAMLGHARIQQLQNEKRADVLTIEGDISNITLDDLSKEDNHQWQYLLSTKLLRLLEEKLPSEDYVSYYSKVSSFIQQRKLQKRLNQKTEAVTNPMAFSQKKIMRNQLKVMNKKRNNSKYMALKGKRRKVLR